MKAPTLVNDLEMERDTDSPRSLARDTLDLCHADSHDAPRAGPGQIRPQKQTSGALCLFAPSRAYFRFGWFPFNCHRGRSNFSLAEGMEPEFPQVIHILL